MLLVRRGEGTMSRKELQKLKEAAAKIARENDTPAKAREILIKIGYLNRDGEVADEYFEEYLSR
jgi:hypothetical protein